MQNTYQGVDNLTVVKGPHTLKFGFEYRKSISPQKFIQRSRGDYDWATLEGYAFDQVPDFGQRSFGSVGYSGDQYGALRLRQRHLEGPAKLQLEPGAAL